MKIKDNTWVVGIDLSNYTFTDIMTLQNAITANWRVKAEKAIEKGRPELAERFRDTGEKSEESAQAILNLVTAMRSHKEY